MTEVEHGMNLRQNLRHVLRNSHMPRHFPRPTNMATFYLASVAVYVGHEFQRNTSSSRQCGKHEHEAFYVRYLLPCHLLDDGMLGYPGPGKHIPADRNVKLNEGHDNNSFSRCLTRDAGDN